MIEININGTVYQNPLLVFALEVEAQEEFNDFQKIFTGVGKINAAYHLFKGIEKYNPDIIINLGTAGSTAFNKGNVVCCTQFIQRDMDVMALGFQKFETPFANGEIILEHGTALEDVPSGICGSGDQFEMEHNNTEYNVIEMEAFALAKVCKEEKLPFLCLKYISDGADGNAVDDWSTEVKKAAQKLRETLLK